MAVDDVPPAILGFANAILLLAAPEETFVPLTMVEKAAKLRRQTSNWAIHAEQERLELNMTVLLRKYLTRPLRMLAAESIVLLVSMYMSFIYSLVYALLGAYPYVFSHTYGMPVGVNALPFPGLFLGVIMALTFIMWEMRNYNRKLQANNGQITPEWRLGPAILGALMFTTGFFWWALPRACVKCAQVDFENRFTWTAFTDTVH